MGFACPRASSRTRTLRAPLGFRIHSPPLRQQRGPMRIAVPLETAPREHRVALVPESCKKLIQSGYQISVESHAGEAAGFPDEAYTAAGASIGDDRASILGLADVVLAVNA